MILGIQLIGIFAGLFMLYVVFLNKNREQFTKNESNFWFMFWILFLFLSVFPHSLDFVVKDILGFSRTLDFFIVGVLMFVVVAIFYSYLQIRKTQKKVGDLVRKIAIDNPYEKK